MLNQKPIFIHAFPRGGSNIIMNLILSHPEVCLSSGETHKVFKGTKWDSPMRRLKKRMLFDTPIRILLGQDFFGAGNLQPRKKVPRYLQHYIDRIFYYGIFTARIATHNLYKTEQLIYTKEELEKCRLLTKGLNGIVYTVNLFREMYPDATFLALIRNGFAVCEGHIRRGIPVEEIAHTYRMVVRKMLQSEAEMSNYHIVRYEDMVRDPYQFMRTLYTYTGLEIDQISKVRLQSKKVMDANGTHRLQKGNDRQVFWYDPDDLTNHIKSDINQNQIKRLPTSDRGKFMKIAGEAMEQIGYL